jgi:hypothetical protein
MWLEPALLRVLGWHELSGGRISGRLILNRRTLTAKIPKVIDRYNAQSSIWDPI